MKNFSHMMIKMSLFWLLAVFMLPVQADPKGTLPIPDTFAAHKIVMQISDRDPFKQTLVLNVTSNLIKYYGLGNIVIEVVAFGPGSRLLLKGNANTQRIQNLMKNGVRFTTCGNTLNNFKKHLGYMPAVMKGVKIAPAGAARILQLESAGYQHMKP